MEGLFRLYLASLVSWDVVSLFGFCACVKYEGYIYRESYVVRVFFYGKGRFSLG